MGQSQPFPLSSTANQSITTTWWAESKIRVPVSRITGDDSYLARCKTCTGTRPPFPSLSSPPPPPSLAKTRPRIVTLNCTTSSSSVRRGRENERVEEVVGGGGARDGGSHPVASDTRMGGAKGNSGLAIATVCPDYRANHKRRRHLSI